MSSLFLIKYFMRKFFMYKKPETARKEGRKEEGKDQRKDRGKERRIG